MLKNYYVRMMYPCGCIYRYDGTVCDLETDEERSQKSTMAYDSLKELRSKYVVAFKGLRYLVQECGPGLIGTPMTPGEFATVSFSTIQRATHQALEATADVSVDVTLPGTIPIATAHGEHINSTSSPFSYPFGLSAIQRPSSEISGYAPPQGATLGLMIRRESEPSSSKTHSYNIESPWIYQKDHLVNVKNDFFQTPLGAPGGFFYHEGTEYTFWNYYNVSNPFPPEVDALSGSQFVYWTDVPSLYVQPPQWHMLPMVIADKTVNAWESIPTGQNGKEDIRDYFNFIDQLAIWPPKRGATRAGFIHFAPADIGAFVGEEYDYSKGFYVKVDVTDAAFARSRFRDRQGNKVTLLHSDVAQTSSPVLLNTKQFGNLYRNVVQPTIGPYSEISTSKVISFAMGIDNVRVVKIESKPSPDVVRVREFNTVAPYDLFREYTYQSGDWQRIVPPPRDSYSGIFIGPSNTNVMSEHPIGFVGGEACAPGGQFFEVLPAGAIPWENSQGWVGTSSPDSSVSSEGVYWLYPNTYTTQLTADGGMGSIADTVVSVGGVNVGLLCFTIYSSEQNTQPVEVHPNSLASMLPTNFSGYVIPFYEDFTSVELSSGSTESTPTASLESQGSIKLMMNGCEDYVVHILEFSDGVFPVRIPIYRTPEKLLAQPTARLEFWYGSRGIGTFVNPVVTGRSVTIDLPQPTKIFVSKMSFASSYGIAGPYGYRGETSLISIVSEEIPDGIIPARYTGTVYVQVVDTYYCEMKEIVVNL